MVVVVKKKKKTAAEQEREKDMRTIVGPRARDVQGGTTQRVVLAALLHTLLNELSQAAFNGYRGDLHPSDAVFYLDAATRRWVEGRFYGFAKRWNAVTQKVDTIARLFPGHSQLDGQSAPLCVEVPKVKDAEACVKINKFSVIRKEPEHSPAASAKAASASSSSGRFFGSGALGFRGLSSAVIGT